MIVESREPFENLFTDPDFYKSFQNAMVEALYKSLRDKTQQSCIAKSSSRHFAESCFCIKLLCI